MTTPYLRTRAIVQAKELLLELAGPDASPESLEQFRRRTTAILLHYPTLSDLQRIHDAAPDVVGPPPPFSRLSGHHYTVGVIAGTLPPKSE